MACNLHTCNCLLVLMIGWLLVERLIKALVDPNVFQLFRSNAKRTNLQERRHAGGIDLASQPRVYIPAW